ncbi:beta-aspartyl-peptidase, partial [Arthrobacter castelli]|uniref:beta-aspartyl-peptidase n=1 Tax=Arthrobacter castelli TaxID=271431 RepID=UPI00047BC1DC
FLGHQDVLIEGQKISFIGELQADLLNDLPGSQILEAGGLVATPGFIDPHVHIMGGGGEGGFANRTPEINVTDIVAAGVTTVVGCLGTDGITRDTSGLLAKARGLEGISTYIFTGNYQLPARTLTGSVIDDIVLIDKIIGAGEIAISDPRSFQPGVEDLAHLTSQCHVGGLLSKKAGVTHFHVGPHSDRLSLLHKLIDGYPVPASSVYATHITRSEELLKDAVSLASKGAFVDMTAEDDTVDWVRQYASFGGDLRRITLSSDGNGSLPKFDEHNKLVGLSLAKQETLYQQVWACAEIPELGFSDALALATSNTADALKLHHKGRLAAGNDADIVLTDENQQIQHAFSCGKQVYCDGNILIQGAFG